MPALTSLSPSDSLDERPTHEPSMEEILASIRRIISDDQSLVAHRDPAHAEPEPAAAHEPRNAPASPLQPPVAAPAQREQPHVNGHTPETPKAGSMEERKLFTGLPFMNAPQMTSPQVAPLERKHMDFADMRLRRQFGEPEERPSAQPAPRHNVEPMPFQAQAPLAKPQAVFHEDEPIASPATDAAVASSFNALFASRLLPNPEMLAELTRDLLRPMLKAWLDDNLPVMVERLVRAEIERVARGGR